MKKIAFIGAGSFQFTRDLVRDILSFDSFADCTIALMDIDEKRLEMIRSKVEKIVQAGGYGAKVIATLSREEALKDADGVLITILSGGMHVWRRDIEIPKKYGVDICVGDTRGPAGIFRYLRTIPDMLDICRDIEKYCPRAIVLNYTNPMAMLCRTLQEETSLNITGLCHSVQLTAEMLTQWIGADYEDVTYLCAGINHQAWFLKYEVNGEDAYPRVREAVEKPEIYSQEIIRNQMFKHLDYYVTESSGHSSEYNAWFRKRPDLIEKYCHAGTGWNPGEYKFSVKFFEEREATWEKEIIDNIQNDEIDLQRGNEYAAVIFNSVFGDNTMFEFNGNVRNYGLIDNLPHGCCVEVPVTASKAGLRSMHVGELPPQLAILNNISAQCEELAVQAFAEKDKHKVFQAIAFDPLTSAVLSLDEIQDMVDEMFAENKEYLKDYK